MSPPSSLPLLLVFLLADVTVSASSEKTYVTRDTDKGRIGGYRERVDVGGEVNVFVGIPFARPPVGDLRFKAPVPHPKWDTVLNATNLPASCYQAIDTSFDRFQGVEMWNPNTPTSEDCLYLNIWEPVSQTKTKAVLVWIYGGGLSTGTSTLDLYDGRVLAVKGDVVVVSMQYRLGALGFLYLGTPDAPGNQGLLDQNLALRWVRDNIAQFGGDPNRVTIFGESAGALSVNLHLLSPLSKDLVRSGIMQSATATCSWGFDLPEQAKAKTRSLAKHLGCTRRKEHDTIRCLQEVKAADLIEGQENIGDPLASLATVFVATIDNHFLIEHPTDTLKKGNFKQKSVLLGVNQDEGFYFLAYRFPDYFGRNTTKELTVEVYRSQVKGILGLTSGQSSVVAETVAFEYGAPYHHRKRSDAFRKHLDDILGDTAFKCPVAEVALAYAGDPQVSVYLYEFNHRTSANPWPDWMGVMHGYEIDHVFGLPLSVKGFSPDEARLSQTMINYWTNFAKSGDPNKNSEGVVAGSKVSGGVDWPTFKANDRRVLVLESREVRVGEGLRERQCQFWRDLIPIIRKAAHEEGNYSVGASAKQFDSSTFFFFFQFSSVLSVLVLVFGV